MPVQFDSPAGKSGGVVFDEQPKGGVVFDESAPAGPSPYTEVIKEMQAFDKAKAEEPTLRQAITAGLGGTLDAMPNPAVFRPNKAGLMALRIGVPLTAGLATGGLGILPAMGITGAAGGLAEAGAQGFEVAGGQRESLSLPQIGAAGIINSFPGIPLTRIASPLVRGGIRVAEGAGLGAAYPAIESGLEGKLPRIGDVGRGALFGAGIGLLPGAVELAGGRTFGKAATDLPPSELATVGRVMREPLPETPATMPNPTTTNPSEFRAVNQAMDQAGKDQSALAQAQAELESRRQQVVDSDKVRALGERMMGKSPEDQLTILDQELRLQKDTLTEAEQRAGLDMKLLLQQQIDQQKALEQAAKAQQDQAKAAQDAQQQAQDAATQAAKPPEVPKSAQILADSAKPAPLANVATEVATQTKKSPFALQSGINKMTQVEAPAPAAGQIEAPVAPEQIAPPAVNQIEPVNIGDRSGRPQGAAEEAIVAKMRKDAGLPEKAPEPATTLADVKNPKEEMITVYRGDAPGSKRGTGSNAGRWFTTDRALAESAANTAANFSPDFKGEIHSVEIPKSRYDELNAAATKANGEPGWKGEVLVPDEFLKKRKVIQKIDNSGKEETNHALQIENSGKVGLRDEAALRQKVGGNDQPEVAAPANPADQAGNEVRQGALPEPLKPPALMKRADLRAELEAAGVKDIGGVPLEDARPNQLMAEVGRLRGNRGAVSSRLLTSLGGAGAGAAYGATQGNSPEERLRNALLYGSLGLGLGAGSGVLIEKGLAKPIRSYSSPVLKDVNQMLTPLEEKSSLFQKLSDAYGNFRYRFNTRFAPIGEAQRTLFKNVGRVFTPSRYYDLERGFERLAGAPVQAEGEVELLQHVIDKLPKQDVPHLDTYLTLSRIKDRLIKTGEENAGLQDAVGRAQAEYDASVKANADNPGVRNSAAVIARRDTLNSAMKDMTENFDRKRVGDWSISKASQGLDDLKSEIGPEAFDRLQQAGSEYQDVMRRSLQIQVDSGRMDPDLMKRILDTNDFYAPFKVLKYFEENQPFVKGGGMNRIPSSEQLAKKITGIDDADVRIGSPTNVAAEQVYKGYILAQKNLKLRQLATLSRYDPKGDYVSPLGAGVDPRKGYEAVTYFVGGQPKRIEVSRPIADALNGMDLKESGIILNSLGKFGQVFKMGATGMNLGFNISNALIFDPARLATISRYGFRGPQDFLYTLYEWPKALLSSARGNLGESIGVGPDALYEQWIKSGAASSTLARQLTPEAFSARLPKDMKTSDVVGEFNFGLKTPIKVASLLSNTLEETTKLLGLQRATRIERLDKLTPQQREQKWDEIVTELRNYAGSPDFARVGVETKPLNIIFPFLNARWQGALADTARLNPFRQGNAADAGAAWARLGSLVAVPAAALAYYNMSTPENEKDYLQVPKSERERYFHIPLNIGSDGQPTILDTGKGYYFKNKDGVQIRGYYRIPKREMPGLISNTMEDFVQYVKSNHPESMPQLLANLSDNTAQTISPFSIQGNTLGDRALSTASGLNPALRLPLEVGLNKNLFTNQPILPMGTEKASPEQQYSDRTPQVYRDVANAMPGFAPDVLRSPAELQHVTEGLTGGFSRQFASPKLSEGNPAGGTSPLVGRFYRSERVESEDMLAAANKAEQERADQRLGSQRIASKLADIITSKPTPEAKQQALNDAAQSGLITPDVQGYLKEDLVDAQRGLNYEDRVVKRSYSIAGGFRAKYYLKKLSELKPEERGAYLQDQANKGLFSRDVQGQLAQMMQSVR